MTHAPSERLLRRRIRGQALSIGVAIAPFGLVFGVACAQAGLTTIEAVGFSTIVFAGSAQFAAVSVLDDGGTAAAAIAAGLLLNVRSLAFGVILAPVLTGPRWTRAVLSQLVIDESTAVATAQVTPASRRYGFIAGGVSVFVIWNVTTLVGVLVASGDDAFVADFGLDAAPGAAFLALLWPRLTPRHNTVERRVALLGALIAIVAVPLTPAGLPILLAGAAAFLVWDTRAGGT